MSFSENIQNVRIQRNITQDELAFELNVSRQAVSKWENGDSYPKTEKLIQLAIYLGVSLDVLFKDELTLNN